MIAKSTVLGILLILNLITSCEILDPGPSTGVLRIVLENPNTNEALMKSPGELSDVLCIISRHNSIKYKKLLPKKGGRFQTRIMNLDPGDNYSIQLYGREIRYYYIVVGAYQSGIDIQEGRETTIRLSWYPFETIPTFPEEGDTLTLMECVDNYLNFVWDAVDGAEKYHFILDDNKDFSSPIPVTELILKDNRTSAPVYVGLFKEKMYYWRVRCIGLWPETTTTPLTEKPSLTGREGPWRTSNFVFKN